MPNDNQTKEEDTAELSLTRSTLIGVGGKTALALIGFAGIVFFYREIGASRFGIYYTVLAAGKLTMSVQGGITTAIKKRVSEVNSNQSMFLGAGLLTLCLFTLFGIVSIYIVSISAPAVIDIAAKLHVATTIKRLVGSPQYLFAALAIAVSLGLFGLANQFYAGVGSPGKAIWVDALRSVATVGTQAALIIAGFQEFGLIWGFVGGTVVTAAIVLFSIQVTPRLPSWDTITRTVSFAKWSVLSGIIGQMYSRFDVLLLTLVLGSTASGIYAPALQLTVPAAFVGSSIGSSLSVKSSGLSSMDKSVADDVRNGFSYAGLIAIPILFGASALPEQLMVIIFGPSASAGALALVGLAAFQLLRSFQYPLGSAIHGLDRPDIGFKILLLTLSTNIPIALLLVHFYGLLGVVVATVIAESVRAFLSYVFLARLTAPPGLPREVLEQVFAGIVMFGVIEGATQVGLTPTGQLTLSFIIVFGAAVYFAVLTLVSHHFRSMALKIFYEIIP